MTEGAPDVVVIGAGVVGCSIALHLRRAGMSVDVLERAEPGAGTSSRGFGLVWVQTKAPNSYLELSMASQAYYDEFLTVLCDDCDYRRPGGLVLLESEAQISEMRALMADQMRTPGFSVEFLDGREVRELEPRLGDSVLGATFSPFDGHLDPKRLSIALASAAEHAGARIHSGAPVVSMRRYGSGWRIEAPRESHTAGAVVNCAGVWAPEVARMLGVNLPVQPIRGQVLVSPPRATLLHHPTPDVRQGSDGRVWMGTIHEPDSWDLTVRETDTQQILSIAARQVPALHGTLIEQSWAGVRPVPRDGLPILGALPSLDGQFVAVGHSGITLCAIEGKLMADLIARGERSPLLAPFGFERFAIKPVASGEGRIDE